MDKKLNASVELFLRGQNVVIHNKNPNFNKTVRVVPEEPQGEIHIYQGSGGYKLSIGDRHLTLAELAYVVDKINAIYLYGV